MYVDPDGTFVSTIIGGIFGGIWGGISAVVQGKNFWAGAAHGAVTGALSGLAVDAGLAFVASGILTGGASIVVGLAIAVGGGFAAGFVGDLSGQMILDGTKWNDINWNQALWTGGIAGITNGFGFGVSLAAGSIGKEIPKGLGLFKTMAESLKITYTPIASWVFQSMLGFSLPGYGIIPGLNSYRQYNERINPVLGY